MPVLRCFGDEWTQEEKIVVSVAPTKTFSSCTALIMQKLGVEEWGNLVMYRTEGRPPGLVRPTVPMSMNTTPQRERMMDGAVIYFKTADLKTQERDRQFQESLEAFRKEHGFTGGLQKDGEDLKAFNEWIATHLNLGDVKDVSESEEVFRGRVEVEEFRSFRDVTFELRDVAQMKDDEATARVAIFEATAAELEAAYQDLIVVPLSQMAMRQLIATETAERAMLIEDVDAERESLVMESDADRRAVERAAAKRAEAERKAREEEERLQREEEARQRREEAARAKREAEEAERQRARENEEKLRQLEMLQLMKQQQQGFADPDKVRAIVDEAIAGSNEALQATIQQEVSKVTGGLKDFVEGEMRDSKRRFDELLAYLMPFHNAAVAASFGAQLTHNAELVKLYGDHVAKLGTQIEQRVESTRWALETQRQAEQAAERECEKLLAEQRQLLDRLESRDAEAAAQADLGARVADAQRAQTVGVLYESILGSKTLLDAIALDHQRAQLVRDVKIAATNANYRNLLAERVAAMERAQPHLYNGCWVLAPEPDPEAPAIDVDALAIMYVFAERYAIATPDAVDALVAKHRDAWRVADELLLCAGVGTSTQFEWARPHVEAHAPNMRPVLDILLDVYKGREVELIASIICQSDPNKEWARADCYEENQDGEAGSPLCRHFYFHKRLGRSQWLMPRSWE